jgi:hypothetical protein
MVLYLVQSAVLCLVQAGNGTVFCTVCSPVSCTGMKWHCTLYRVQSCVFYRQVMVLYLVQSAVLCLVYRLVMVLYLVQSAVLCLVQADNGTEPCTECIPVSWTGRKWYCTLYRVQSCVLYRQVMLLYLVQIAVLCLVQAGNGTVPFTECSPVSCTGR